MASAYNALQLLEQLISTQPEGLKPVFNRIVDMFKSTGVAFDGHVAENENIFSQIQA